MAELTELMERLAERAKDPELTIDESTSESRGLRTHVALAAVVTDEQITSAANQLGFPLPDALRSIYQEVGNGGFGPGFGIFGLATTAENAGLSLPAQYAALRQTHKRPAWPKGLIPICDWGAGIGSYVDCLQEGAPVIRIDPNMPKGDVAGRVPPAMWYPRAPEVLEACWIENTTLLSWFEAWADNKKLFYLAYGQKAVDEEISGDEEDEDETDDQD